VKVRNIEVEKMHALALRGGVQTGGRLDERLLKGKVLLSRLPPHREKKKEPQNFQKSLKNGSFRKREIVAALKISLGGN